MEVCIVTDCMDSLGVFKHLTGKKACASWSELIADRAIAGFHLNIGRILLCVGNWPWGKKKEEKKKKEKLV